MEFFSALNVWYQRAIAGSIGAAAGYAYYYYIGCLSGTCPITSDPYISTLYGFVVGALLINRPQKGKTENGNDTPAAGQKI